MMKKLPSRPLLALLFFLLVLLCFPKGIAERARCHLISSCLFSVCQPELTESGLHAQVIYREPASWSSSIWINAGQRVNDELGFVVLAKDSPVLAGGALVGVVEEVEKNRSRVRLISDLSCNVSVQVLRGGEQNRLLHEKLMELSLLLKERGDLYGAEEISRALIGFSDQLDLDARGRQLAKGVLHGTSAPLWRSPGQVLKGEGFNYDFSDAVSASRNLRTGALPDGFDATPLIKTGDFLITTGMDGIFPAGLLVATVTKILPLNEGGCSYALEAKPIAHSLNALKEVAVLPPLLTK